MDDQTNALAQRLFSAFMQFRRVGWQRTVAGCKPSEIKVLFCIKRGMQSDTSEIKVSEISRLMYVTSPNVTQLIKGLEAKGLIERHRDPADRRAVGLRLTEKGEMVTEQAREAFLKFFDGLVEYLGEEQSDQLAELMFKVLAYHDEQAISMRDSCWSGEQEI